MGGLMHWEIENAALRERIALLEKQVVKLEGELHLAEGDYDALYHAATEERNNLIRWLNELAQECQTLRFSAATHKPEGVALQ